MCQEIHASDVRLALLNFFDEEGEEEDCRHRVDDVLAQLEVPNEEIAPHAIAHARRAKKLAELDDGDAASIHTALLANMARAAG